MTTKTSLKRKVGTALATMSIGMLMMLVLSNAIGIQSLQRLFSASETAIVSFKSEYTESLKISEQYLGSQFFNLVANLDLDSIEKHAKFQLSNGNVSSFAFFMGDGTQLSANSQSVLKAPEDQQGDLAAKLKEEMQLNPDIKAELDKLAETNAENAIVVKATDLTLSVWRRFGQSGTAAGYMWTTFDLTAFNLVRENLANQNSDLRKTSMLLAPAISIGGIGAALMIMRKIQNKLSNEVVEPVIELSKAAEVIASGKFDTSIQIKSDDEIGTLGNSFNTMVNSIRDRDQKLKEYASGLEVLVDRKTAEIRNILDNVSSGLIGCTDKLIILPGHSKSCLELFSATQDGLIGKSLIDLLNLSQRDYENFQSLYDQIFESPAFAQLSSDQLPKRFTVGGRQLSITASPVVKKSVDGIEEAVEFVLFNVIDYTELARLEREASINKSLISIIRSPESFKSLIRDFMNNIPSLLELVKKDQAKLRHQLHTYKGNFGVFEVFDVSTVIHQVEGLPTITEHGIKEISRSVQSYLNDFVSILDIDFDADEAIHKVPDHLLTDLTKRINSASIDDVRSQIIRVVSTARARRASELLSPLANQAPILAKRLGKSVKMEIYGGNIPIPDEYVHIFQSFVHWLRNAIDHGIETPSARHNKPKIAKLEARISASDNGWLVELSDDGKGLDLAKITKLAVQKKIVNLSDGQLLSVNQAVDVITKGNGLSTSDTVTEISGRGVGLGAIRSAVEKVNGKFNVSSSPGKGMIISVLLPSEVNGEYPLRNAG